MSYFKYDGSLAVDTAAPVNGLYGTDGVDTLSGTSAADSLWGGQGDLLRGGAGDDTYYLKAAGDRVVELADQGIDKIVAWTSVKLTSYANVENLEVDGDGTYGAGNAGDNIIAGGAGAQQLYGGGGQDVLIGGAGADTFIIVKGQGNDVIQDFTPADGDVVRLSAGFTSFSQVQSHLSQVGADVKLDLGDGDGVIFRNLQLGQLSAANFALQLDTTKLGAMTFDDEFSGPLSIWDAQSNPTGTWRTDYGYQGSQGVGSYTQVSNNEQQIYVSPYFRDHPGDFAVNPFSNADGVLSITAAPSANSEIFGYNYTSGMISTQPTFAQTYGYFEMRAELPQAAGAWPAFWLIPADGSWPPELDVMETLTSDPNADWTTWHSAIGGHTSNGIASYIPDTASGFHTYGVMWTPTDLTWYVDGTAVFHQATPADMNKPMYMIANLALGGWGGAIDNSQLPAQLNIDYIHAYSLGDLGGATTPPVTTPPVTTPPVTTPPATGGTTTTVTTTVEVPGTSLAASGYYAKLTGGDGSDTLTAARGGETLAGGAGSDLFVFTAKPIVAGHIADFQVGLDKIDVAALLPAGYKGDLVADHYVTFTATPAGDGTKVMFDPDGAGKAKAFQLVVLDGVSPTGLTSQIFGTSVPVTTKTVTTTVTTPPVTTPPTTPPPVTVPPTTTDPAAPASGGVLLTSHVYADTLTGGAGADTLQAGQGPDQLTGGAGADSFVFKATPWNAGHITDFQPGTDKLDLSALYTDGYHGADPVADGYVSFVADGHGGTTVLLDTDGRAGGNTIQFQIATLDGVNPAGLTAAQVFGGPATTATTPPATTPTAPTTPVVAGLTLTSSQYADTLAGGAGADTFVFDNLPWNAGHITDFTPGSDVIDLRPLFAATGYAGTDPIADHYLSFQDDGAGGTRVMFDPDGPGAANPWPTTITTLDGVAATSLHTADFLVH